MSASGGAGCLGHGEPDAIQTDTIHPQVVG